MKTIKYFLLFFILFPFAGNAQEMTINGILEWDKMEFNAELTLDLHRLGIRLPGGRLQAESLLEAEYSELIRPLLMSIQADSTTILAELVNRGEIFPENFMGKVRASPPILSRDQSAMSARYSLSLNEISAGLFRHTRPQRIIAPLIPAATREYTGIIIIADESLPVHGRAASAVALPCLFPRIWDSEMNLLYDRNMIEAQAGREIGLVHYTSRENIMRQVPSGLDDPLIRRVGENPLRIMARGLFGAVPTDPIIDMSDALLILSTENNRRLLAEGRIILVLDKNVLKQELTYN